MVKILIGLEPLKEELWGIVALTLMLSRWTTARPHPLSWPRADSLAGEKQRTGSRFGSGSEPVLELAWWKRGKRGT